MADARSNDFRLRPFHPAAWLPGGHAHTVAGRFLRPLADPGLKRTRLELPDGDFLDLYESEAGLPQTAPIVVILHGLEGCHASNYMITLARQLSAAGIRGVRMNFRGCGGEMNRLPRFYHAGDTADLHFVIEQLREKNPSNAIGAVGFSLGGNVLLKYLGERGEGVRGSISAAVGVSVPFDLESGTRQLERWGMSRIYTQYFMRKLRRKTLRKGEALAAVCDVESAARARTIRQYDDLVTARLHGFRDAWEYYNASSSASRIADIRVPTLILHARNDPFLPAASIPAGAIAANSHVTDGVVPLGGHVGFIEGMPWRPRFWAEEEAARFLAHHLVAPQAAGVPVSGNRSAYAGPADIAI